MFSYEPITNLLPSRAETKAKSILETGWSSGSFPAVILSEPVPWALHDQSERPWNFRLHSWDMLDAPLLAYSQTRNIDYLRPSLSVAKDWVDLHIGATGDISPFAWYDMAVGMRSYRLAYLLDAAQDAALLTEDAYTTFWRALELHATYLADDANIRFHNNHGYYQVAGQLAMGRRFSSQSEAMADAWSQGRERLQRMLNQQFTSEGIHREHSPDYHRMVYETLRGLIDSGLSEDSDTVNLAKRIESALSWFILPDRHIANFGDSDYRWMGCSIKDARVRWRTPEMQYAVTGGALGRPQDRTAAFFSDGGYFVLRRPGPENTVDEDPARASYLAQSAGFHSRTHKQADDLSFIWSDRGANILVDSGRYGYIGRTEQGSDLWRDGHWYSDPNRIYCESTRAHNTLEIDGRNYPRRETKPYGSALQRWAENDGIIAVESECSHFRSVRHARLLVTLPSQWLFVLDWFHDNRNGLHDVRQWFHFSPQLMLTKNETGFETWLPDSRQPLRAISLLPGSAPSSLMIGQLEDPMQGWWSPAEREAVPNYTVNFGLTGASHGVIATLFSFSTHLDSHVSRSQVNTSGRNGRLYWTDENGEHCLFFERPKEGSLKIARTKQGLSEHS